MTPADISRELAARTHQLVADLLSSGKKDGREWRVGSITNEAGQSLAVHLQGQKAGLWFDFATQEKGDALDLVRASLGTDIAGALAWSRRWLGIDDGAAEVPRRPATNSVELEPDPERWRHPWGAACPIGGTPAATYLAARGLMFADPDGRVLRFASRRARKGLDGDLQCHPAMLALLSDLRSGESCGIINTYLAADGRDRLRDTKGKTVTGRARAAVVMLSAFDEPINGLVLCEGVETGIAIYQSELQPVWACGSAGTLVNFPVLAGVEALTIAADADEPGQRAAETLADRWREAGRKVSIVAPPAGDWADRS
jgi:hypothetical protein